MGRIRYGPVLAVGLLASPVLLAASGAIADPEAWPSGNDAKRIGSLLANTMILTVFATLLAVPAGVLTALTLDRMPMRGAGAIRMAILMALFIPLPVWAVAWQIVLGSWLPRLALTPGQVAWRPWQLGLAPACVVHAAAGWPWVVVIVLAGLRTCDRHLEDEALMTGGPARVLRRVLLPRALLAGLASCVWIGVQCFTEIPVTDAMMVRTFAEEVYTQLVSGYAGLKPAMALLVPGLVLAIVITRLVSSIVPGRFPLNPDGETMVRNLPVRATWRVAAAGMTYSLTVMFLVLPIAALCWKAAGGGTVSVPSPAFAVEQIMTVIRLNGLVLAQSILAAIVGGTLTAWLATWIAWRCRESALSLQGVVMLAVVLAFTPGPIVGQALKEVILLLVQFEKTLLSTFGVTLTFAPLRSLLYDQPSPVPTLLVAVMRYFPLAFLIVWPVIRSIPKDRLEQAALDGVSAWRVVGRPATARATALAVLAVAGLVLGEVSAGKLVAPPGYRLFILDLFDQMHYGAEPTVAAMALVQILLTAVLLPVCYLQQRN